MEDERKEDDEVPQKMNKYNIPNGLKDIYSIFCLWMIISVQVCIHDMNDSMNALAGYSEQRVRLVKALPWF